MSTIAKEFTKGLWDEIPPFRFVLGLCPALAVTKTAGDGLGMGLATTFVLVCSNVIISSLRKVIPNEVRVACYIVVIATFVVCVEMFTKAFTYPLYESLGIFIPLIVVNCIILGRAEAFAKKNGAMLSLADGLGMGMGFTISLAVLGAIREFFGAGTLGILGILPGGLGEKLGEMQFIDQPFDFLQQAPGAFVALGLMLGIMNVVGRLTRR